MLHRENVGPAIGRDGGRVSSQYRACFSVVACLWNSKTQNSSSKMFSCCLRVFHLLFSTWFILSSLLSKLWKWVFKMWDIGIRKGAMLTSDMTCINIAWNTGLGEKARSCAMGAQFCVFRCEQLQSFLNRHAPPTVPVGAPPPRYLLERASVPLSSRWSWTQGGAQELCIQSQKASPFWSSLA